MPRVVLSWTALTWITLSILCEVMVFSSLFSSSWLQRIDTVESRLLTDCPQASNLAASEKLATLLSIPRQFPSIGPWFRCQMSCRFRNRHRSPSFEQSSPSELCQLAMWGFGDRPSSGNGIIWSAACFCLAGCAFLSISLFFLLISLCKREICERSILSFTASVQGLADLLLLFGLLIWPVGWDSVTVREVCGGSVGPYSRGNCTIGLAPIIAGCSVLLLFVCALLAIAVDKSLYTHSATRQMLLNGKTCMFLR